MSFLGEKTENTRFNLDPRTKLILLIIVNIIVFHSTNSYLSFLMIGIICSLFLLNKKYKVALCSLIFYFLFTLVIIYVIPYMTGILVYVLLILLTIYKLLPIMLMGAYLILTTNVSEFIASLEKIHMPQEIIIPLAVFFRFIPTVFHEGKSISDAMKMSGLGLNVKNIVTRPLKMLEYWFIPLIMSIVKTGDELSAAVLTRSMDNPVQRTNICKIGFHLIDFIYLIIAVIILIIGLIL